jgi:putative PIN family toxin of toxin-antitoxin system
MIAVFDCMVFLQAATSSRGPAFACLQLAESGAFTLTVSPAILAEVRMVLLRPKTRSKFATLTDQRAEVFLQKLSIFATVVAYVPNTGFPLRDPTDVPYVDLAAATGSHYLVSWDNDLLVLMNDASFVSRFPQLQIVDPVTFLNAMRAMTGR